MSTIQEKAEELVKLHLEQMHEANQEVVQRMLELGYTDESHRIVNNILDVLDDPSIPYKVWAEPIPRFNRANTGE